MKHQKTILIIEDHEIILWALMITIGEKFPDYVVHTAPTFDHGIHFVENNFVSLIILDIDVPGGNSTKMITFLRKAQPRVAILIHTAKKEEESALRYMTAGANGFLSKSSPFELIEKAISTVLEGQKYMSANTQNIIAQTFLRKIENGTLDQSKVEITEREREVIKLLLSGKWTKEIADELRIKWNTVSTHKLANF